MLVVNGSNIEKDWAWLQKNNFGNAELHNISEKTCLLAIQGPNATKIIQALTDIDVLNLKYYTFTKGRFAGVDNVLISATGYTGAGFYSEVKRVGNAGSVIAAWTYPLLQVDPYTDSIIQKFYYETLNEFWDPERKFVDNGYATIPFPFKEIPSQEFTISLEWTLADLEGYLNTWSATQKYITAHKANPVHEIINKIKTSLDDEEKISIHFPVHVKLGYVH
jgi:hypothetical protein